MEDTAFWLRNWFSNLEANTSQANLDRLDAFITANQAACEGLVNDWKTELNQIKQQGVADQLAHVKTEATELGVPIIDELKGVEDVAVK